MHLPMACWLDISTGKHIYGLSLPVLDPPDPLYHVQSLRHCDSDFTLVHESNFCKSWVIMVGAQKSWGGVSSLPDVQAHLASSHADLTSCFKQLPASFSQFSVVGGWQKFFVNNGAFGST
jgi:hypothetical protein